MNAFGVRSLLFFHSFSNGVICLFDPKPFFIRGGKNKTGKLFVSRDILYFHNIRIKDGHQKFTFDEKVLGWIFTMNISVHRNS